MYSTCIFCNKPLGANETVEHFPVGRRLAFDAARGRLWVVCRSCERWNLTPLEERWEAIEECERFYRDTRVRVSTDQIGLARLKSGLELVRIGEPLRPEFAAWRYGDQFGRRRRRQMLIVGAGLTALGGVVAGGMAAGVGMGGFWWMLNGAVRGIVRGSPDSIIARVPVGGDVLKVRRKHLSESYVIPGPDGELGLHLTYAGGVYDLTGDVARRAAGLILPAANRFGGSKSQVAGAVSWIEGRGSAEDFLRGIAHSAGRGAISAPRPVIGKFLRSGRRSWMDQDQDVTGLAGYDTTLRLALEMALHEDAERRALDGELAQLEEAWRDAEEIAGIADNMFLPPGVDDFLRDHRKPADKG
jgi:hypothetical protein